MIISGTGSNCVLLNPQSNSKTDTITTYSAGGWGSLLGDEGSGETMRLRLIAKYLSRISSFKAYWIAQRAIKYLVDVTDNFIVPDEDVDHLRDLVFGHFNVRIVCQPTILSATLN